MESWSQIWFIGDFNPKTYSIRSFQILIKPLAALLSNYSFILAALNPKPGEFLSNKAMLRILNCRIDYITSKNKYFRTKF